jgi:hypothetical protein
MSNVSAMPEMTSRTSRTSRLLTPSEMVSAISKSWKR